MKKTQTFLVWLGLLLAVPLCLFLLHQPEKLPVEYDSPGGKHAFMTVLDSALTMLIPLLVIALVLYLFFRKKIKQAGFDLQTLRQSPAKLVDKPVPVHFADVAGCETAKEQLGDVVDFLKNPGGWERLGARLPHGILLEGPAGCGKTLLARAVAGETNAKFYTVSASEFVELFVGVGAARMRDTFEKAAKTPPAIIFIDEIDALGRRRGSGIGGGHDEREQTLNQLFMCLDGFHGHERLLVLAATNRADILDQALLRPGRFDRRIKVPVLNRDGRLAALKIHTRHKPLIPGVNLDTLADATPGFTGADIENLANEAALIAARHLRDDPTIAAFITQTDFDAALAGCANRKLRFTAVDAVLMESASQFTEPAGEAWVRLTLDDGTTADGKVLWADAAFLKLQLKDSTTETIWPKRQIAKLEILPGTGAVASENIGLDVWARQHPETR